MSRVGQANIHGCMRASDGAIYYTTHRPTSHWNYIIDNLMQLDWTELVRRRASFVDAVIGSVTRKHVKTAAGLLLYWLQLLILYGYHSSSWHSLLSKPQKGC